MDVILLTKVANLGNIGDRVNVKSGYGRNFLLPSGKATLATPANVAKFLAVYLRGWSWANANKTEAIAMMKKFYEQGGVTISEASMRKEFDTRPTFNLTQQLQNMDRSRGASVVDGWFTAIGEFMRGTGAVPSVPGAGDYITDAFMKRVAADPKLRDFANKTN